MSPFILPNDRIRLMDPKEAPHAVGELCYKFYKPMVDVWKEKKSWTLFHNMLAATFGWNDLQTAKVAALMVFFIEHVMPYEQQKKLENGDIQ